MEGKAVIRNPEENEFMKIYEFVSNCKPLENYEEHFYRIMLRYFSKNCLLAEVNDHMAGFILGFISQNEPKKFFIWQVGVNPNIQGKGIGSRLVEGIEKKALDSGSERSELTVDPENTPSQKLFEKLGYSNISDKDNDTVIVNNKKSAKDFYKPGRHFIIYSKELTGTRW